MCTYIHQKIYKNIHNNTINNSPELETKYLNAHQHV